MKAFVIASLVLGLAQLASAQDDRAPQVGESKGGILKALQNKVRMDMAATWDGDEVAFARSDIEVHLDFWGRLEVFARVNLLPFARKKIAEKLKHNEDIIEKVSAAIALGVRNQLAVQLGRPADQIIVPQNVLQTVLAAKLATEVDLLVERQLSPEAQRNAALREIGFAVRLLGGQASNQKIVFEVGKIDSMYSVDEYYFQNHFRLSRPAVRLKYSNEKSGLVTYIEAGNDAGLWEIANPQANASLDYIATVIARSQGRFFDLSDINSWELGVIKTLGSKQKVILAMGTRPVLERGVDSQYVLAKYNIETGGFLIELSGSLEKFDDPAFGETVVKRFEAGISRDVKGFDLSARTYSRYDALVRRDFNSITAGFIKPFLHFSGFTMGVGGRVYVYKYRGFDDNGEAFKWQKGGDIGFGLSFGEKPVKASEILLKQYRETNEANKKNLNK